MYYGQSISGLNAEPFFLLRFAKNGGEPRHPGPFMADPLIGSIKIFKIFLLSINI